ASAEQVLTGVDVSALVRELSIITESEARELGIAMSWEIASDLPRVRADHSGLLQVLLNLIQNSLRELAESFRARIVVAAYALSDSVVVRVSDNGPGIAASEALFQPFQAGATSAGLGLYVSRAIIRTYGGELQYLRQENESFFLIELRTAPLEKYANA
ncbi:MAG TPA: ATP-binding protein, partial [Bryobacteraceae bacterium]|nr:ATP-binding protein [Bryobacteraceae bacterium]